MFLQNKKSFISLSKAILIHKRRKIQRKDSFLLTFSGILLQKIPNENKKNQTTIKLRKERRAVVRESMLERIRQVTYFYGIQIWSLFTQRDGLVKRMFMEGEGNLNTVYFSF